MTAGPHSSLLRTRNNLILSFFDPAARSLIALQHTNSGIPSFLWLTHGRFTRCSHFACEHPFLRHLPVAHVPCTTYFFCALAISSLFTTWKASTSFRLNIKFIPTSSFPTVVPRRHYIQAVPTPAVALLTCERARTAQFPVWLSAGCHAPMRAFAVVTTMRASTAS